MGDTGGLVFTWDTEKAQVNTRKHRVSFQEAATIFSDPLSVIISDPLHSIDGQRFILLGASKHRTYPCGCACGAWRDHSYYQRTGGHTPREETL